MPWEAIELRACLRAACACRSERSDPHRGVLPLRGECCQSTRPRNQRLHFELILFFIPLRNSPGRALPATPSSSLLKYQSYQGETAA